MKGISFWFIFLATLFALAGMAYGIKMGISDDHFLAPAHAHNNLVGWVTLALYGLFYAVVPQAGTGKLALAHFWLALTGALCMGPGIAMSMLDKGAGLVIFGSIVTILGMLAFSINVYRHRQALPDRG